MGLFELTGDLLGGVDSEIFYCTNPDLRVKNDGQEAVFIHVEHQQAMGFTLLIDAAEVGFANEGSDSFGGSEGSSREGSKGGGVKVGGRPDLSDEKAAFVDDDGG